MHNSIIKQNMLNDAQKRAVNSFDKPLLILAGAGTGKTLTITLRIANLIVKQICPAENILAVTFTNKAATEMKTRIEKFVGSCASKICVGTFHSVSARILRTYARAIGLEPSFLIIDEYDKKKLITNVIHDCDIDEKRFPVKICQFIISSLKEKCINYQDVDRINTFKYRNLDIVRLYQTYQTRLRGMNAVDFDDLIFECVQLFKREPKILQDLQQKFKYITVDEYQDTNEIQHLWLQLLVGSSNNICCVGDEDQSIYGWRGAKVDYILNFSDDFLGSEIIRLEQNYRSTQSILEAAMSVISNNKQRYNKQLTSNILSQEKPNLYLVENDKEENINIIKNITNLNNIGILFDDIAILVRATYQMRGIEDYFIKNSIPYKIVGGIKFYERKEIKDLIAYLRWCYSLTDVISLERIINTPKRGIGEKTLSDMLTYINRNNWNLFDGLQNIVNFSNIIGNKTENLRSFLEFTQHINDCFNQEQMQLCDIMEKIYFNSGYADLLQNELPNDPEIASKIDNIREFISSMKQFNNIEQFLEHIALVSTNDDDSKANGVNIMTMHAAKGLEFSYVFLPAWEEGCFPSQKTLDESGNIGLEEERRLAYVALTRARKNFFVYSAKQRMQFGKIQLGQPSRFITEMHDRLNIVNLTYNKITADSTYKYQANNHSFYNNNHLRNKQCKSSITNNNTNSNIKQQLINGITHSANIKAYNTEQFHNSNPYVETEQKNKHLKIGDKVYSQKFGDGIITAIYGKFYEVKFNNSRQITQDVIKKNKQ